MDWRKNDVVAIQAGDICSLMEGIAGVVEGEEELGQVCRFNTF